MRGNFFYRREFVSDDNLNAQARRGLDEVATARMHGTLKERISDRFERERPLMGPLAPRPYTPVVPRPEPRQAPERERQKPALPQVKVERRRDYALGGQVYS